MDKAKAPLGGATGVGPVPVIETSGLTKQFGDRAALSGLDLAVPGGSAFGLLGANGAGKTTLIRTVLGLTAATSGSVRVLGQPMPGARAQVLARVGAVVEEPRFHGHLTGRENLRVAAAVRGREAGQRVGTVLERVGLAGRADERVAGYSLGMRQRLGIARCLLSDPLLLILDEPMNGLDPAGIIGMREMIRTLVGEGRTVVISSHLLDEVEKTCDAVAVIDRGRLIAQGPVPRLVGADEQVLVGCTEAARAMELLSAQDTVAGISVEGDGLLRVTPRPGCTAASLNRLLVRADICVGRLEPVRATLEERFLQILSTAGEEVR